MKSNPTHTKRTKTVELTHMEVLKLITADGHFWRGPCPCPACEDLRVKVAAKFPALANEFVRRAASS